jgi:hypothetical protein
VDADAAEGGVSVEDGDSGVEGLGLSLVDIRSKSNDQARPSATMSNGGGLRGVQEDGPAEAEVEAEALHTNGHVRASEDARAEGREVAAARAQVRESATLEAAGGMRNALANPETSQALASASAALREVRSKASGLTSDDQASVFDKVIHQQRMQLEQLRLEKAAFERERAEFRSKAERAPLASSGEAVGGTGLGDSSGGLISRVGAGSGGAGGLLPDLQRQVMEMDVEKMIKKIRNPKRVAVMCCIVVFCLALFVRTQRRMDQVGTMDATQFDLQVEHSEMEKLVGDLMKDKALLAKERRGSAGAAGMSNVNGTQADKKAKRKRAMEKHLATVQRLLEGMHRRHLEAQHGNQLALAKENEKLAQELSALRRQLSEKYQKNHNISSASVPASRAAG